MSLTVRTVEAGGSVAVAVGLGASVSFIGVLGCSPPQADRNAAAIIATARLVAGHLCLLSREVGVLIIFLYDEKLGTNRPFCLPFPGSWGLLPYPAARRRLCFSPYICARLEANQPSPVLN